MYSIQSSSKRKKKEKKKLNPFNIPLTKAFFESI